MKKRQISDLLFWVKHLALALLLIVLAIVLIQMQRVDFTTPKPEGAVHQPSIKKGLSDFYADYRRDTKPIQEEKGDFVMSLNPDDRSLTERLKGMQSERKPVSDGWVGEHKFRTFKAGSTLRETISRYARSEGMQLLWELDQDFIIKYQFQIDNTVAGSLAKIATSIDSNFIGTVTAYICPSQRTLVITAKKTAYLADNCTKLTSQSGQG